MLAEFLKLFSKIHSVTHSVTKVIFCVLQFFSKLNLKSFHLNLKGRGWQRPFTTAIAPEAKQTHYVLLLSPGDSLTVDLSTKLSTFAFFTQSISVGLLYAMQVESHFPS